MKKVFSDVEKEYQALRSTTGLVDYEGIGLFVVAGPQASAFLNHVATRTVDFLLEGQVSNALLLRDDGTIVAEVLMHCRGEDYLLEAWPAQAGAARDHLTTSAASHADVTLTDVSDSYRVFGVEGPESFRIAATYLPFPVASMAYNSFATDPVDGVDLLISRTGVTGEYGFKLHVPAEHADRVREELISAGATEVGQDALDVCRMETRFANLEGEAAGAEVTPFDLGLQWMVSFDGDFVGAAALQEAKASQARRPVCWQATDETVQVPAAGTAVTVADQPVGEVSHAVWSPTLRRVIGTARLDAGVAASGLEFTAGDTTVRTVSAPFLVATSFGVTME